ncbi:MAG: ASKHA domain-containing protein [Gaiellales bacterium]
MSSAPEASRTLFDEADDLAIQVPTSCRRSGRCHECVVEILEGAKHLGPRTPAERFLAEPYRLACQAVVTGSPAPVRFSVLRRRLRILVPGPEERARSLDPVVNVVDGVVHYGDVPLEPLRGGVYGIALDLGTTTIVLELVDLTDGRIVEVVAIENPQRFGGSDVMSRISYDTGPGHGELRQAVRRAVNRELREAYARHGVDRREVYELVVVGNSTMRDLFFGLDVASIGQMPYKSLTELDLLAGRRTTTALTARPFEVGVHMNPRGRVFGGPLIASHVGADVAADLVALGIENGSDEVVMLVDVGTNTEVVVRAGARVVAASCPAGPAFEGGLVTYGMQASDGAIESFTIREDGTFAYETIGGTPPVGICGSGLIDLLAELRRAGRMSPRGPFSDRSYELTVVPEAGITFSRADASALAQAKAANTVGQWALLRSLGIAPGDVDRLYLAGGFASYVDVRNAIEIGFLAPVRPERIVTAGNAALKGARELLLSRSARERLESFVRRIEHVELEQVPDFFELFVEGCQLIPIPPDLGKEAA